MENEIEKRRSRVRQLFVFTDKFTVNPSGFNVEVGKQFDLEGIIYEVIAIHKNEYLDQEYVFLNNIENILPF